MTQIRADLDRIENLALTALREQRQLIRRIEQLEQATLEVAAALRRSGITPPGGVDSPFASVPDRQSAEAPTTIVSG